MTAIPAQLGKSILKDWPAPVHGPPCCQCGCPEGEHDPENLACVRCECEEYLA